ncbi:hypothetical protein ACIPIC_35280 [Streptomyces collinus]
MRFRGRRSSDGNPRVLHYDDWLATDIWVRYLARNSWAGQYGTAMLTAS